MRRRKFAGPVELAEDMSLQITSMADIFTIVLVFLLKTQVSGIANLTVDRELVLPEASAPTQPYHDALQVEIHREGVLVDQRLAAGLKDFSFAESSRDSDAALTGISQEVYRALVRNRSESKAPPDESRILLLADEKTPYSTLNAVIGAASAAGYVDLQLAVVER